MSILEISSSTFSQKMKLPLSPPLVEGSALEPLRKDLNEVEEKPKDIIKFTAENLSIDEVSQLVISSLNNFEGKKNSLAEMAKHIAVFHRLGLVPVSEASIIFTVSSVHRASSLQAVSYPRGCPAIDTLKAKVPIWRKEIYEELSSSWKRNKECFWEKASGETLPPHRKDRVIFEASQWRSTLENNTPTV
uniref:Uncharacterized protein n=1 Tax=Canis lupus dingo TaxID=286419 RepID=A0A8C0L3C1_CANLU